MQKLKYLGLTTLAAGLLFSATNRAPAQVAVEIGAPPVCPYGYYEEPPYTCAPDGYYGPEWFNGGVFIGAGRYYHGGPGFYGHVNRSYDPRYGYHGGYPQHGPYQEHPDHFQSFHASHYSDPGGHYHTEAQHGGYVNGGHR